ncbi:hypothetical protein AURDEDRAFT_161435 [Auricularia subglabra TFB-10046 SS5]|nr:hypothetical protein AURDEDRAFT_161435 [Auricularia subglabra TFB-10046 SS5]
MVPPYQPSEQHQRPTTGLRLPDVQGASAPGPSPPDMGRNFPTAYTRARSASTDSCESPRTPATGFGAAPPGLQNQHAAKGQQSFQYYEVASNAEWQHAQGTQYYAPGQQVIYTPYADSRPQPAPVAHEYVYLPETFPVASAAYRPENYNYYAPQSYMHAAPTQFLAYGAYSETRSTAREDYLQPERPSMLDALASQSYAYSTTAQEGLYPYERCPTPAIDYRYEEPTATAESPAQGAPTPPPRPSSRLSWHFETYPTPGRAEEAANAPIIEPTQLPSPSPSPAPTTFSSCASPEPDCDFEYVFDCPDCGGSFLSLAALDYHLKEQYLRGWCPTV